MEKEFKLFSTLQEADEAEDQYYRALSPNERVNILLDLVACYGEAYFGPSKGFERIYRVVRLEES